MSRISFKIHPFDKKKKKKNKFPFKHNLQQSEKVEEEIVLLPPAINREKIVCIGLNDYCTEQNKPKPKELMFFNKFASCWKSYCAQNFQYSQKERSGGQFVIGKSMESFCPLGPTNVHKSLVKDPHNLQIITRANRVDKQSGNTKDMIYKIDDIIHDLTKSMTLKPGDIILTGTPSGVGMHRNPLEYLKPADVIGSESEIEALGKLVNKVVVE